MIILVFFGLKNPVMVSIQEGYEYTMRNVRITALLALLPCFAAISGGATVVEKKCLATYHIERGGNPWSGMTSSAAEEAASMSIRAAVADEPGLEAIGGLDAYRIDGAPPLLRSKAAKSVVVNKRYFSALARADATRIRPGAVLQIGRFLDTSFRAMTPGKLVSFLLESQIIITYWHIEAQLCLEKESDTAAAYAAWFTGQHVYFTNERNVDPLRFVVRIDRKNGAMTVEGY